MRDVCDQNWQEFVLSVQLPPGTAAPQPVTDVGELLAKIRSKSGAPPEKAMPVATTVSVWPTTQQGPAGPYLTVGD